MLFKSQNALWNMVPFWHVIIHFLPQWPLCHWVLVLVSFAVYFFCQSWTFLSIKEEHSDWWCEVFQGVWDFLRAPDFFEAPKNSFLWRSSKSLKNHLLVVPEPGWSNSQWRIYRWSSNYMYQKFSNFLISLEFHHVNHLPFLISLGIYKHFNISHLLLFIMIFNKYLLMKNPWETSFQILDILLSVSIKYASLPRFVANQMYVSVWKVIKTSLLQFFIKKWNTQNLDVHPTNTDI